MPVKVGVVSLVRLSVLLLPVSLEAARSGAPEGAAGAIVSTTTVSACEEALAVPPGVRNFALMAVVPSLREVAPRAVPV